MMIGAGPTAACLGVGRTREVREGLEVRIRLPSGCFRAACPHEGKSGPDSAVRHAFAVDGQILFAEAAGLVQGGQVVHLVHHQQGNGGALEGCQVAVGGGAIAW